MADDPTQALRALIDQWHAKAATLRERSLQPRNDGEGIADAAIALGLSRCADGLEAYLERKSPAALAARSQWDDCIRCGHHRKIHGTPCGFHSCGCPQFFGSECEVALATERELKTAWEKRAYQAEAALAAGRAAAKEVCADCGRCHSDAQPCPAVRPLRREPIRYRMRVAEDGTVTAYAKGEIWSRVPSDTEFIRAAAGLDGVYRDGVKAERCATCHALLRDAGGAPMVSILLSDLEEVISILVQYVDCPPVWGPTIRRFEQAAGRTVAQMQADAQAKRQQAADAVDPSAADPGKPSTRDKGSSS